MDVCKSVSTMHPMPSAAAYCWACFFPHLNPDGHRIASVTVSAQQLYPSFCVYVHDLACVLTMSSCRTKDLFSMLKTNSM